MSEEHSPGRNRFGLSGILGSESKSYRIAALFCFAALLVIFSGLGGNPPPSVVADTTETSLTGNPTVSTVADSVTTSVTGNPEASAVTEAFPPDAEGVLPLEELAQLSTDADATEAEQVPRSKAETLLAEMTLREKVFQLFIVFPDQLTGKAPVVTAGDAMKQGLQRYPVGGILFDRENMQSREQLRELLGTMQTFSRIPMLMTCDEEGGRVNRLMGTVGTPYVGAMLSYRDKGPETAKQNALTIAGGLTSCAFNMDFAPVADVWSNPDNKVIGNRAYSTDYAQAAELVRAAVEGFHEGGVACTLKHFPGHGNTYEDSHNGLARVYRTWKQLEEAELLPFRAGIDAGADAVMVGHLIAGEIDPEPATISRVIVTDMLRNELGFQGVVVTDSLQMDAVTKHYTPGEVALRALEAGVDMLLAPNDLSAAGQALLDAVDEGRLTEARLDESVLRILTLKERYGILR